jgi:thiol-disulfide isomerase/thioredoxin
MHWRFGLWQRVGIAALSVLACSFTAQSRAAGDGDRVGINEGDVPPPYVGRNLKDDKIRLTEYAGKPVVLSFWATWCGYCLKELPILSNIQKAAGPERIAVLAINTEDWRTFVKASKLLAGLEITMLNDSTGSVQEKYGVKGIPHMLILDHQGRVKKKYVGYGESMLDSIVDELNQVLTAAAAAKASAPAPATAPATSP